jgi:hypothetical protein
MQNLIRSVLFASLWFVLGGQGVWAGPLSNEEKLEWTRHLVPKPRKLDFRGAVTLSTTDIAVVAQSNESLVQQAAKELRECLGKTATGEADAKLQIRLQVDGKREDVEALDKLPNRDQGYLIYPNSDGKSIMLVGGGVRGAYYAGKTMQQLLNAYGKDGTVRVPVVEIKDWPDMEDRGFWGGDSYDQLRWMSDRKLNYDEQIAYNGVDADKRCNVKLHGHKQRILDEGPTYGINGVPVVLHLEQLSGSGLFDAYPELKGKNGRPGSICYSNPRFVDILSQWLLLWKAKPGVTDVDVWMAENLQQEKGCQCEQCLKEDRSVLEVRAIIAGWKKANEGRPESQRVRLRVLTSEETEKANPRIIAELPENVKLWYYHSLFTYNTSHRPMIRPYLVDAIRKGHWVGVCPNVCAIVGTFQPFTGPQFIHARMNEFVDKKLSGLLGYAVPGIGHCALNAEAAAEWTWNAKGRSPHEFALSWAVRQSLKDPNKFAAWCDANGPVAWDIYGSEFPSGDHRGHPGRMADLVRAGKLPNLGEVLWEVYGIPFGDIQSVEQLRSDVKRAAVAVQLSQEIGEAEFMQESLVIQGYINAIEALWELRQIVKPQGIAEADKPAARKWFKVYVDSMEQAAAALPAWEASLRMSSGGQHYTRSAVEFVEGMASDMNKVAADLGCAP